VQNDDAAIIKGIPTLTRIALPATRYSLSCSKLDSVSLGMVDDVFPWVMFLPKWDRTVFVNELIHTLAAVSALQHYSPVGRLLRESKATAEIHADPRLAGRLPTDIHTDD